VKLTLPAGACRRRI